MTASPRLGVTLFSYTREYWAGAYTLADCLAEVGKLGDGHALELIGAQSLRGYPRPAPGVVAEVRALIERHGLEPICYGAYFERGRSRGRVADIPEAAEIVEAEIEIATRLGFPIVRLNTATPELLQRLLPAAERANVAIAVELHQKPIESPEMQDVLALFDRLDSPHVGFVQDLGAMMTRLPDSLPDSMFLRTDPETLSEVLPHLLHVHGKFFGMDGAGEEPCIPYAEILRILRDGGYAGAIASEYLTFKPLAELDSAAQVQAHHQMIRRLWRASPPNMKHEEAAIAD